MLNGKIKFSGLSTRMVKKVFTSTVEEVKGWTQLLHTIL